MMSSYIAKPPIGTLINWGHPLAHGLAFCAPFWERSGPALHDVVHGSDGVLTAMDPDTDWVSSAHGPGLDFNGADDYVDHGYILSGFTAMTVAAMFIRGAGQGAGMYVLVGKCSHTAEMGFYLAVYENDLRFQVRDAGAAARQQTGNTLAKGQLILGVGTYDGNTCRMYVNGAPDDGGVSANGAVTIPNTYEFAIGVRWGGAFFTSWWLGGIFGIWVWDRALSAAEVRAFNADPFVFLRRASKVKVA